MYPGSILRVCSVRTGINVDCALWSDRAPPPPFLIISNLTCHFIALTSLCLSNLKIPRPTNPTSTFASPLPRFSACLPPPSLHLGSVPLWYLGMSRGSPLPTFCPASDRLSRGRWYRSTRPCHQGLRARVCVRCVRVCARVCVREKMEQELTTFQFQSKKTQRKEIH